MKSKNNQQVLKKYIIFHFFQVFYGITKLCCHKNIIFFTIVCSKIHLIKRLFILEFVFKNNEMKLYLFQNINFKCYTIEKEFKIISFQLLSFNSLLFFWFLSNIFAHKTIFKYKIIKICKLIQLFLFKFDFC